MSKEATARSAISTERAMKLALDALEYIHEGANNQGPHTGISWRCVSNKAEPAITALREALTSVPDWAGEAKEQPAQQEPVIAQNGDTLEIETILYTSPQPAQQDIPDLIAGALGVSRGTAYDMMREALAEQSAQQEQEPICKLFGTLPVYDRAAQQQEPVAWMHEWEDGERIPMLTGRDDRNTDEPISVRPLVYADTSPPAQRKPLTDDEIKEVLTKAIRAGQVTWLGYEKDEDGRYTIPSLSINIYQISRAIEAAHGIKENT